MSGQLYLLPCPISEAPALDALPASTVETARRIDHFLVEAARTARATLKAMGHPKPIAELDIVEIGHDPAPELISEWLQPVLDGGRSFRIRLPRRCRSRCADCRTGA